MVSIRHSHVIDIENFNLSQWCNLVGFETQITEQLLHIERLYVAKIPDKTRSNEIIIYAIEIINMLSDLSMNEETIITGFLFPMIQEKLVDLDDITEQFGENITHLLQGVLEMEHISQLNSHNNTKNINIDNIRRMLLAMVDDFRCVIIKLCERIAFLRLAKNLSEEDRVVAAQESYNIYAPLANRLGIGQLKWELEDFSFSYLHPKEYKKIANLLNEKRKDRELYIEDFVLDISDALKKENIQDVQIYGRPKHIYSIWRKMQKKNLEFSALFDVRAVRVITTKLQDCYAALGVIHTKYKYLPREFDDYITNPKPNGYQSIHTVVYGKQGLPVEVQIRTQKMHDDAELGVAAHWKYKEGTTVGRSGYEEKITWLRKLLEWQEDIADSQELIEEMRSQVFDDRVYVFTPNGEVIDLPTGATPLDFAYTIHSEVGNTCVVAKVNSRIVPFSYNLQMGEQVEIITKKNSTPSRDWLNPNVGFVKTNRAKNKIANWFKKQDKEKNIPLGKEIVDTELAKLNITIKQAEKHILARYNIKTIDDFYVSVANNDVKINNVVNYLNSIFAIPDPAKVDHEVLMHVNNRNISQKEETQSDGILINGIGNLMHHMAKCCQPIPGDNIIGYITQGNGISIHKKNCSQFNILVENNVNRIIDVNWQASYRKGFYATIKVIADNSPGVLRDLTAILANEKVKILKILSNVENKKNIINYSIDVEVLNVILLSSILNRITQLPEVIEAKRLSN